MDEKVLKEYVATANNPEYKGDWNIINSKFPEFKDVDKTVLKQYVVTANNPQYKSDYSIINSKFPEFFQGSGVFAPTQTDYSLVPGLKANQPEVEQSKSVASTTNHPRQGQIDSTSINADKVEIPISELGAEYQTQLTPDEAKRTIYGNIPGTTKIGDVSMLPIGGNYANTKDKAAIQALPSEKEVVTPAQSIYGKTPQVKALTSTFDDEEKPSTGNGFLDWYGSTFVKTAGAAASLYGNVAGAESKAFQAVKDNIPGGETIVNIVAPVMSAYAKLAEHYGNDIGKGLEERGSKLWGDGKTITENAKSGTTEDYINIVGKVSQEGIKSIPAVAGFVLAPEAAIPALAASSFNEKYDSLNETDKYGLPANDMSNNEKVVNAVGSGVITAATLYAFGGLQKTLGNIYTKEGGEVLKTGLQKWATDLYLKSGIVSEAAMMSGLSFVSTVGDNAINYATGLDKTFDPLKGTGEAAVYGAGTGLVFGLMKPKPNTFQQDFNKMDFKSYLNNEQATPEQIFEQLKLEQRTLQINDATQNAQSFIESISNNGQVIEAKLKGVEQPVNITTGEIFLNEDGSLDRAKSSKKFIYKTNDGKAHPGNLDFIEDGSLTITSNEDAVNKSIQPIKDQIENEDAPEYPTGSKVVIKDQDGINSIVTVSGRNEDGTYMFNSTDPQGQPIKGGFEPREVNNQFTGVFDGEYPVVEYTDPETQELKTGVIDLETQDAQQFFSTESSAVINGRIIPFENIKGQYINEALQEQPQGTAIPEGTAETQNAGVETEAPAETAVVYPTKKDGTIDFENMTDAQIYDHTKETEGEEAAQFLVARQVKRLQQQIADNQRNTAKLAEETNKLLSKSKTMQEDKAITAKQTAKGIALSEEATTLATKLKDLQAYLPKVETPAPVEQPKKVTTRPEILQLQKEEAERQKQLAVSSQQSAENPVTTESEQPTETAVEQPTEKVTTEFKQRIANLDGYVDMEDYILQAIAGGQKFKWKDGLGNEFRNSNKERIQRINYIDETNGLTPTEFAHLIYNDYGENGNNGEIPGVRDMSDGEIVDLVNEILRSTKSNGEALRKAEAKRNDFDMNDEDFGVYQSVTTEEQALLDELPDEYLSLNGYTDEQLNEILNIINYDPESANTSASEPNQGIEGEKAAEPRTTEEVSSLIDELAYKSSNADKFIQNLQVGMFDLTSEEINPIIGLSTDNTPEQNISTAKKYYSEAKKRHAKLVAERKQEADNARADQNVNNITDLAMSQIADMDKLIAESDTKELDNYIAEQEHKTNPTEKQKETGIYPKARVNLQHHNITIETLKGTNRTGIDEGGQKWSVTMQNHYGELDGTVGYDNDPIDIFIGNNPKQGQIFVVDQISPDGSFDESKVMLGFDSAEEAKAAYMSNYSEGWSGFGSITPSGDNFKEWLYDGKKQKKPFSEYKDTPEAVKEADQLPDTGNMVVKNGSTVTYQGKQYTVNGITADGQTVDLEGNGETIEDIDVNELDDLGQSDRTTPDNADKNPEATEEVNPEIKEESKQPISIVEYAKNAVAKNKAAVKEQTEEKIEDFGEKIEGARKDQLRKYYNKINLNGLTLSTIFPKPVFKELLESGLTEKEASAVKVAYEWAQDEKKHKRRSKEAMLDSIRFYAAYAKTTLSESLNIEFQNNKWQFTDYGKAQLELRASAYEKVAKELGKEYLDIDLTKVHIRELTPEYVKRMVNKPSENEKYEVDYYVSRGKKFATLEEALTEFVEQVRANTKTDVVEYKRKLNVYNDSKGNGAFIGYQPSGKQVIRLKEGFKTGREAFDYRKENEAELQEMLERIMVASKEETKRTVTRLKYTNETTRERVGKDWREGKDVSSENFAKQFGFRAVEYGNWVNQKERQVFLNNTYDSLMDLAQILGITPKAISLDGRLAISFGSRGSGGASAHYEPERTIINLTKTKGLGSLAHEWFHGVDNYFAGFKVSAVNMKSATLGQFKEGVRPEVQKAFRDLYDSFASGFKQRSRMLDMNKSKNYFALPHEMAARAFESYVLNKTVQSGQINDFIANYVSPEDWNGNVHEYPYPIPEESKTISEAFDNLFSTIQEDESGALYEPKPEYKGNLGQYAKEVNEWNKKQLPAIIEIDGVQRSTTNSNGKPLHSTEEGIRNFWKWFGDSKVVDESGRPLVVYHGAMSQVMPKDTFKGYVSYFTDSKQYAETFGIPVNRETMSAYLKLENPYIAPSKIADVPKEIHDTDEFTNPRIIKSETDKFDGVIGKDAGQKSGRTFVVFDPTQIKSATGNNGAFDVNDASILNEPTQTFITFTPEEITDETTKAHGSQEKKQEGIDKTIKAAEGLQLTNGGYIDSGRTDIASPVLSLRTVIEGFKEAGYINFNGTKVTSHQDIADLWSIHRSPYIEKGHVVFIKDGVIVGTIATTANKADVTKLAEIDEIIDYAQKFGATGVYLLHNHPSGNPMPSSQDIRMTLGYSEKLDAFGIEMLGHVVVDHDKYSVIDTRNNNTGGINWRNTNAGSSIYQQYIDNNVQQFDYTKPQPKLFTEREVVGKGQDAPEKMFEIGKTLLSDPSYKASVVFLSNSQKDGYVVSAHEILPDASLEDIKRIAKEGLDANLGARAIIIHDGSYGRTFGKIDERILDIIDTSNKGVYHNSMSEAAEPMNFDTMWAKEPKPDYKDFNGDIFKYSKAIDKWIKENIGRTKREKERAKKEIERIESIPLPNRADFIGKPFEEYLQAKKAYIEAINNIDLNEAVGKKTEESVGKHDWYTFIPGVTEGKEFVTKAYESFTSTFIPYKIGKDGRLTKEALQENLGHLARRQDIAEAQMKQMKKRFDNMSKYESLEFIDNMERGLKQPSDELDAYAKVLRDMLDTTRGNVQALGTGKLDEYIENYFPHMWGDPKKANAILGKKPLEGTKSFLKKRTIEFTKDGVEKGLIPVSWNPVQLAMLKVRDMERYVMAHETLNELKEAGIVHFVRIGTGIPEGYLKIDDKVGTIQKPNADGSLSTVGHLYAAENAARVINNYLSKGLWGNIVYDTFRGLTNTMTQVQLGLSAFHLGFTTLDATISKVANGIDHLFQLSPIDAAKQILQFPVAFISNPIKGDKLLKAWYGNPSTPEMEQIAKYMEIAGGRAKMDQFYANGMAERIRENVKNHKFVTAGLQIPLSILEWTSKPIMEYIVPRQKLGVFADMTTTIVKNHPDYTPVELRIALQKAWSSVDNRLGQLVYDNLFWNKVTKDVAMATTRAVGWNLGSIREIVGAPGQATEVAWDILHGRKPRETRKVSYLIAMIGVHMLTSAILQYLLTGTPPEELEDYFFPKRGGFDSKGDPKRVSLPSYWKDIYAYSKDLVGTVENKLSPVFGMISELIHNKDYYGNRIINTDDTFYQQGLDYLTYFRGKFVPFGIRNVMNSIKEGSTEKLDYVLPFIGITPAPSDLSMTKAEKRAYEYIQDRLPIGGKTKEQADDSDYKRQLTKQLQKGADVSILDKSIEEGTISVQEANHIEDTFNKSGLEKAAVRLGYEELREVYKLATEKEKEILKPIIEDKLLNKLQDVKGLSGKEYDKLNIELDKFDNGTFGE